MRGKSHDPETKAAVMAALLAGQGVTEVATAYKLDPSVVSRWRKQIPAEKLQELATEKGLALDDLILDYLQKNFAALGAMAAVASDESYLRKYPPQQLAVLHGVFADKAFRLLEAAAGAGQADEGDAEAEGSG